MKEESIGDPDIYLGSKLRKVTLPNGVEAWMISPAKYICEAIKNVEKYLESDGSDLSLHTTGRRPTGFEGLQRSPVVF
jgi:hypothetical protein